MLDSVRVEPFGYCGLVVANDGLMQHNLVVIFGATLHIDSRRQEPTFPVQTKHSFSKAFKGTQVSQEMYNKKCAHELLSIVAPEDGASIRLLRALGRRSTLTDVDPWPASNTT